MLLQELLHIRCKRWHHMRRNVLPATELLSGLTQLHLRLTLQRHLLTSGLRHGQLFCRSLPAILL